MARSRVFVVTPCFNAAETIARTIASVLTQEGDFALHYHVQDGGSSDETLQVVERWKSLVDSCALPLACNSLRMTYDSRPDNGIYDAICLGFEALDMHPADWMAWINADDILMPGSAALLHRIDAAAGARHINWIVPGFAILNHGTVIAHGARPQSAEILRAGLADGRHWEYVQQEGVFFRNRVWRDLDLNADFRRMSYAGDWNLWRRMAEAYHPYQVDRPLGGFRLREGQTSTRFRDRYEAETEDIVPLGERLQAVRRLNEAPPYRLVLHMTYPEGNVHVRDEPLHNEVRAQLVRLVGAQYDAEWRSFVEHRALQAVRDTAPLAPSVGYVGFPWTTLIAELRQRSSAAKRLVGRLDECAYSPEHVGRKITVCDHPAMLHHRELFARCGITDIFWSHAAEGKAVWPGGPPIVIRPFPRHAPLPFAQPEPATGARELLCTFLPYDGAVSQVRAWILDRLEADPRALARAPSGTPHAVISGAREVLARSAFALCPPEARANRPEFWDAIGCGAIPVVFGPLDGLPGPPELWSDAVVTTEPSEEAVGAILERLASLATDHDRLARMRQAMSELWLLYGPDNLIHDIRALYLSAGGSRTWSSMGQAVQAARAPASRGHQRLRVHLLGASVRHTPLTWPSYRKHFEDHVDIVEAPERADIVVAGAAGDVQGAHGTVASFGEDLSRRVAVLCDSASAAEDRRLETAPTVLSSDNSRIFDFRRIPLGLTRSDEEFARYNFLFSRGGPRRASALLDQWAQARWRLAAPLTGLPEHLRTAAERLPASEVWWLPSSSPERPADLRRLNMAVLDRRVFLLAAIDQTGGPGEVIQHSVDALAHGAVAVCEAAPAHPLHQLARGGFLNFHGLPTQEAAALLQAFTPTREFAESWLDTREHLAAVFCDPVSLETEREMVAARVVAALRDVANGDWRDEPPTAPAASLPLSAPGKALERPFRHVRIVGRFQEGNARHLHLEVTDPHFQEPRLSRIGLTLSIVAPSVCGVEVHRAEVFPPGLADQLDWREADGSGLWKISLHANSETARINWSSRTSAPLHRFVIALAQELPVLLMACPEAESNDAPWKAAASTLAAAASQLARAALGNGSTLA